MTPYNQIGPFVRFLTRYHEDNHQDPWRYDPASYAPLRFPADDWIAPTFGIWVTPWVNARHVLDVVEWTPCRVSAPKAPHDARPLAVVPQTLIRFIATTGSYSGGPRNPPYDHTYVSGGSFGPESIPVLGSEADVVRILAEAAR